MHLTVCYNNGPGDRHREIELFVIVIV